MINDELHVLENKIVEDTSNKRIKISQEMERSFNDPEFKVLGFIGDKMFIYTDSYVSKYTFDGNLLCRYYVEVTHGTFHDNVPYFFVYKENVLYKFSQNLQLLWFKELEDEIYNINMDSAGNVFILFRGSRVIMKLDGNGDRMLYLYYSNDPTKSCKLHKIFISSGRTWLYVVGTISEAGKRKEFIVKYNTITGKEVWNQIYKTGTGSINDNNCVVHRLHVNDEKIFIEGYDFIMCVNPKMLPLWEYKLGYNDIVGSQNRLSYIEYDNSSFDKYIYFCEDLYDTNGFSIGKLDVNGNLLWKYTCPSQDIDPDFSIAVDDEYIYTWGKESINMFDERILSLNNNSLIFYTNESKVIRIVEYNKEIYDSSFYEGFPLYGDTPIRENPEYVYKPLLYKEKKLSGRVTDEEGNNILLSDENTFKLSDEDYIYMRLIGDLVDESIYDQTSLLTRRGINILTSKGKRIYTSKPYNTKMTYKVINDLFGNALTDKEGNELTELNGRPTVYFGLLADYFKMYAHLVTKRLRRAIVTKRTHSKINKKEAIIYKYKFRKLKDINLLVEFLVQNNVLQTVYPNYIEKLRKHSFNVLQTAQNNYAPCYFDLKTAKMDHFTYDAEDFRIDKNYESIFLVKNMPFNKKKEYRPLDIRPMVDMVKDETVTPFLLFVNGRCIKWTDITIVRDWHEAYLIIDNMNDNTVYSDQVDCILFPCTIRYGEDNEIEDLSDKGLYFTEDGIFTSNLDKVGIRIEVLDDDIISETNHVDSDMRMFNYDANRHKLATERNIFVFEEGLFYSDNRYYIDDSGYNIFRYTHDNVDATFRTFLFIKGLESKDLVFKVPNKEGLREELTDMLSSSKTDRFFRNNKFNISFTANKPYDRNVAEALNYVVSYDKTILSNLMKENQCIDIYSQDDLIDDRANGQYLIYAPKEEPNSETFYIPFVDGLLYNKGDFVSVGQRFWYKLDNSIITDTEEVEVAAFHKCCNGTLQIRLVHNERVFVERIIRENSPDFSLFVDGTDPIECDFQYEHMYENGQYAGTEIKLDRPIPPDGMMRISSERHFYHQRSTYSAGNVYKLSNMLLYSRRPDHFMVFINGHFTNKWNIENNKLYIRDTTYTNIEVVDIFYLPDSYQTLTCENYNCEDATCCIKIPEEFIEMPFNNDNYWVFIGGMKVPSKYIEVIDPNTFKLKEPYDGCTYYGLQIVRFGSFDKITKELFDISHNEDLWSKYVKGLSSRVFQSFFE